MIATGHGPPSQDDGIRIGDPWASLGALRAELHRDDPVLLVGTGLTAVDVAISLLDGGHRGRITGRILFFRLQSSAEC